MEIRKTHVKNVQIDTSESCKLFYNYRTICYTLTSPGCKRLHLVGRRCLQWFAMSIKTDVFSDTANQSRQIIICRDMACQSRQLSSVTWNVNQGRCLQWLSTPIKADVCGNLQCHSRQMVTRHVNQGRCLQWLGMSITADVCGEFFFFFFQYCVPSS